MMVETRRAARCLVLALAGVGAGCHAATAGREPVEADLVGRYRVVGMQADGTGYSGLALIDDSAGPRHPLRIRWTIGAERFEGALRPEAAGRWALRFTSSVPGGGDYRLLDRGRIEGRWWNADTASRGWETLRRLADDWTPPRVIERYVPMAGSVSIGPESDDRVPLTDRGYTLVLPSGREPLGIAVFFDGWRITVDSLPPAVGSFEEEALRAGVGLLHITTGDPLDFLFGDDEVAALVKRVERALHAEGLAGRPLLFAGLSLGGTRALRVAIEIRRHRHWPLRLAAVALVDAPLDMIRVWTAERKAAADGFGSASSGQGRWVSYLLETRLGGPPDQARARYVAYSPFVFGEPGGGNAAVLEGLPLRAYHEPDVNWWIEQRRKSYYQMNSIDLAALVDELRLAGSQEAELITTTGARDGYGVGSSPQSWSIVDNADLVRWFLRTVREERLTSGG